jgi:hypothetical protein
MNERIKFFTGILPTGYYQSRHRTAPSRSQGRSLRRRLATGRYHPAWATKQHVQKRADNMRENDDDDPDQLCIAMGWFMEETINQGPDPYRRTKER